METKRRRTRGRGRRIETKESERERTGQPPTVFHFLLRSAILRGVSISACLLSVCLSVGRVCSRGGIDREKGALVFCRLFSSFSRPISLHPFLLLAVCASLCALPHVSSPVCPTPTSLTTFLSLSLSFFPRPIVSVHGSDSRAEFLFHVLSRYNVARRADVLHLHYLPWLQRYVWLA